MSLHDDRCATLKGHPCNCASAALQMPAAWWEDTPPDEEGATLSSVSVKIGRSPASVIGRMQFLHDNAATFEKFREVIIKFL